MQIFLTAKSMSNDDVVITEKDLKNMGIDPYTIQIHLEDTENNRDIFAYPIAEMGSVFVDAKSGKEDDESIFALSMSEFSEDNGFKSYLSNGLYSSRNPELNSIAEDCSCATVMMNQGIRDLKDESKRVVFYDDTLVVPTSQDWGPEKTVEELRKLTQDKK